MAVAVVVLLLVDGLHSPTSKPFAGPAQPLLRALEGVGLGRSQLDGSPSVTTVLARWLLVLISVFLVYETWATIFRAQYVAVRLRLLRNHIVVCGGGAKGTSVAAAFRAEGRTVVLIDRDSANAAINDDRQLALAGDALDRELLWRAGIVRAERLIAVCNDPLVNAEIGERVQALTKGRAKVPVCHVHIGELDLFHLIRARQIESRRRNHRFEPFNVFDIGARLWLERFAPDAPAGHLPHVALLGLGRLGESIALHAARMLFLRAGGRPTPRIHFTVVDPEAERRCHALQIRYPALAQTALFTPIDLDLRSPSLLSGEALGAAEASHGLLSALWICTADETTAMTAGLALRSSAHRRPRPMVRVTHERGLLALLHDTVPPPVANEDEGIDFFPLIPATCQPKFLDGGTRELLARSIHTEYVRHSLCNGELASRSENLANWDNLAPTFQAASRAQADAIGTLLHEAACGIAPLVDWHLPTTPLPAESLERLSVLEHRRWVDERLRDGWRFGASKDLARKVHPSIVAWEALPESEREKDRAAVGAVPFVLAQAGFRIIPIGT